ncbi:MAG: M1 family metallopeptidase [Ignavibacteriae bacterium]|nr:M1 family metallopeptidase [Ignavibacteriota bacterium]MCB9216033.1 M1 family metallopeptidase [Ignavibacteria bacterium]
MIRHLHLRFALCSFALFLTSSHLFAWQQRVHYQMEVHLEARTHSYRGTQRLTYVNNSPDTIETVYYHLFYNAFTPGSGMDRRDKSLPESWKSIDKLTPDQRGNVEVRSLTQKGTPLQWSVYETILTADLAQPLLPGDSTEFVMEWKSVIPLLKRRGGWNSPEGIEFSMSQWYPKLAEYDRNGWHPDEYVEREFYGVFGTFDVEITLPANYVVGGTGIVTNPSEVKCGYDFQGQDTTLLSPASGSGEKTWKFHAENVHDFAWVADQQYAHQITHVGETRIHILVKRSYLERFPSWRYAPQWTREILEYYSTRFGQYAWPQFTVAHAGDGGMEYPMLIMITGYRGFSSLYRVIAHEAGHQWYYGMMANNETQQAWLDEGLTQFLTDEANRNLNGEPASNASWLRRVVYPLDHARWREVYPYCQLSVVGYDEPLNTYHDRFREPTTASLVYSKGEAVVRQLQYMFGDSLFDEGMRRYYNQWKFRHPDQRDFERAMEESSGMRLDWFFNQWIGSDKTCDYAMESITSEQNGDGTWQITLELSNRDEIVMPIDLTLTYEDGTTATANIPAENWKKPGVDYHLPRWFWVDRTYRATFTSPKNVIKSEIDPSITLLDLDRTNNIVTTGVVSHLLPPSHVAFWRRWDLQRPLDKYSIRLRPTIWYSEAEGGQVGFLADGGYAFDRYNSSLGLYYNIGSSRINYNGSYETPVSFLGRLGRVEMMATNNDGLELWRVGLSKELRPFYYSTSLHHKLQLYAEHSQQTGKIYPNAVAVWDSEGVNRIGLEYQLTQRGWEQRNELSIEVSATAGADNGFAQWKIQGSSNQRLFGLDVEENLFLGTSLGTPSSQFKFNGAGSSSRTMHDNVINRLGMNAAPDFAERNHLILPTEGYLIGLTEAPDSLRYGNHLANGRVTVGFRRLSSLVNIWPLDHIGLSLYAAGGWVLPDVATFKSFEQYHVEGGSIVSIDLLNLLFSQPQKDLIDSPNPVRLSLYIPFWTSSTLLEDEGLKWRWGISISE